MPHITVEVPMIPRIILSLFPALKSCNALFLVCLYLVVNFAIIDKAKHCIAQTAKGRKCTKDTTPQDFVAAMEEIRGKPLRAKLEDIVLSAICKSDHFGQPHSLQAAAIAREWIKQAEELEGFMLELI